MGNKYLETALNILKEWHIDLSQEDLEQEINLCILEIQKKETIQKNDFEKEFLKRMQIIHGLNNKDMNYLRRYRHLLNKIQELKSRSLSTKEILKELEISPEVYYYLLNLLENLGHNLTSLESTTLKTKDSFNALEEQLTIASWFKKANLGSFELQALLDYSIEESSMEEIAREQNTSAWYVLSRIQQARYQLLNEKDFVEDFVHSRKKEKKW